MKDLINDIDTVFFNEFVYSFKNKERLLIENIKKDLAEEQKNNEDMIKKIDNSANQIKEISENTIKEIKRVLSFFGPYSFKSNEPIEEVCLQKEIVFNDFQELIFFEPNNRFKTTFEEFKGNILLDISSRLLNFIFQYCIDKFNLKPIINPYKGYFLQKNEEVFFYKNCCFDKYFFKKISIDLYDIKINIETYNDVIVPHCSQINLFFNFEIKLII